MEQGKLFDIENNNEEFCENDFDWTKEFPQLCNENRNFEGFDVVIGNPPYISLKKLPELKTLKKDYKTYNANGDIYTLFIERGMQILKPEGRLSFITSNKWMRAGYGKNLREYLLKNTTIEKIIDFDGLKVFDEATVDTNIISIFNQKNGNKNIEAVRFDKTFDLEKDSIHDYFENNKIKLNNLSSESWNLKSEKENLIKTKIEKQGIALKNWNINIYRGITTGFNEAFVIDTKTKNKLIKEDKKNKEYIKPLVRGRDIKKYTFDFQGLWLLYIPWHFPIHQDKAITGCSKLAEETLIKKYNSIYKHLLQFKIQLLKRNKSETEIRYEWYAMQRSAATYINEFEKEKIIFTKASQTKSFAYDNKGYYLQNTSYILTNENLKYLLALLNSKLITFAFLNYYQSGGIEGEITVQAINEIPIPKITKENKKTINKIENLVTKILTLKKKNNETDISAQSKEIDKLVYRLYNFTEDEIQIIENETR